MKFVVITSLFISALLVLSYLLLSARSKKRPDLNHAVSICFGVGGTISALKIIAIVIFGLITAGVTSNANPKAVELSFDDYLLVIIGEFCLIWLSTRSIYESLRTAT